MRRQREHRRPLLAIKQGQESARHAVRRDRQWLNSNRQGPPHIASCSTCWADNGSGSAHHLTPQGGDRGAQGRSEARRTKGILPLKRPGSQPAERHEQVGNDRRFSSPLTAAQAGRPREPRAAGHRVRSLRKFANNCELARQWAHGAITSVRQRSSHCCFLMLQQHDRRVKRCRSGRKGAALTAACCGRRATPRFRPIR